MALPGRKKTFALQNCRDLHLKLEREIERFKAASHIEARIDHAFNAVVTAWHLCDWVYEDLKPAQKIKLKISSRDQLQKKARKECRALHLCQQVANASKHWRVTKYPDRKINVTVTATADGWSIDFIDGRKIRPAEQVFDQALEFWTHFIYQNEVGK